VRLHALDCVQEAVYFTALNVGVLSVVVDVRGAVLHICCDAQLLRHMVSRCVVQSYAEARAGLVD
jgi:hypothetical protein